MTCVASSACFTLDNEQRGCKSAGLLAVVADKLTIHTNADPTLAAEISDALQTQYIMLDDRKIKPPAKCGGSEVDNVRGWDNEARRFYRPPPQR
jgi:hypothetical protein